MTNYRAGTLNYTLMVFDENTLSVITVLSYGRRYDIVNEHRRDKLIRAEMGKMGNEGKQKLVVA